MKTAYSIAAILGFALLSALPPITAANAAEIKIFTARLGATALREVGPQFERESGQPMHRPRLKCLVVRLVSKGL
jgi:hypothetical protein